MSRHQRPRSRKEEYQESYNQAKSSGHSFFPYTVSKDAVIALVVVVVIVVLALVLGVKSEPIADPTSTTYNPRPEWYFLFLFKTLTFFPGWLEPVANIVVPGVAVLLILLVPFLDRSKERHPFKRPVVAGLGVAVVIGLATLTYLGAVAPRVSPPPEQTPEQALGQRVYRELNCAYCHSINGRGGAVGPDLSDVGSRLDKEALRSYLRNPADVVMHTLHPKFQFTPEELEGLTEYLFSLGAPPVYTEEAPKLFATHCASCHTLDGTGGTIGPDLSQMGSFQSSGWIAAFIHDPKSVVQGATMPGFQGVLSDAQINDIANYLASFKAGTQPTITPTATVTPTPTLTATPTPASTPPMATPTPVSSPTPVATPTVTSMPTLTATPTATPTPTPVATPTATTTPTPTSSLPPVSYLTDVQPILNTHCTVCHGAAMVGGLDLRSYEAMTSTGEHAPIVLPGSAQESLLYRVLLGPANGIPAMPPGSPLGSDEIGTIGRWIDQGAPNN